MDVLKALLKAHKAISKVVIEKVVTIYDRDYDTFSGMMTYRLRDNTDSGIRTNLGLYSESNLSATGNAILVYIEAIGANGRVRHEWRDGVMSSYASGNIYPHELTQSMKEMNVLIAFINTNDALPVNFYGDIPPIPDGEDALMDENGVFVLDERYGLILTE